MFAKKKILRRLLRKKNTQENIAKTIRYAKEVIGMEESDIIEAGHYNKLAWTTILLSVIAVVVAERFGKSAEEIILYALAGTLAAFSIGRPIFDNYGVLFPERHFRAYMREREARSNLQMREIERSAAEEELRLYKQLEQEWL